MTEGDTLDEAYAMAQDAIQVYLESLIAHGDPIPQDKIANLKSKITKMPAKDIYHDTVKRALEKDGWTITKENLHLRWGRRDAYVDIAAEKVFTAAKEGRKIAV